MARSRSALPRCFALAVSLYVGLHAITFVSSPQSNGSNFKEKIQGPRLRSALVSKAAGSDSAEAKGEESLTDIEREAAKLRAEVAELEEDKKRYEQQEQEKMFEKFDADSSGTIDPQELQSGVKKELGVDADQPTISKVIADLDENKDGVLQPNEFDLKRVEASLNKIVAEEQAKRAEEKRLQLKKQQEDIASKRPDEPKASLQTSDEDNGLDARVGSIFAYFLPTLDAFRFAGPLKAIPAVAPVIGLMNLANNLVYSVVPFGLGGLLIFIVMQQFAADPSKPKLLRFNFQQGVLLSIFAFFPGILGAIADFGAKLSLGTYNEWGDWSPGKIPQAISDPCCTLVFLVLMGMILYSVVTSLTGAYPNGIPYISAEVERRQDRAP